MIEEAIREAVPWLDANQSYLAAHLARVAALLDRASALPGADATLADAQAAVDHAGAEVVEPALDRIVRLFGLTDFERDTLLLCAGVELDAGIARRCAGIAGGPWGTFGTALGSFQGAHWSALLPHSPLRGFRLVEPATVDSIVTAPLRAAEPVIHALAGLETLDGELAPLLTRAIPAPLAAPSQSAVAEQLSGWLVDSSSGRFQLVGDDAEGQRDVAAGALARIGRGLWTLPASEIPRDVAIRQAFASTWSRDAALLGAALLITRAEEHADAAVDFALRISGIVGFASVHRLPMPPGAGTWPVALPEPIEQRNLWRQAVSEDVLDDESLGVVSSQFRLSASGIERAALELVAVGISGRAALRAIRPATDSDAVGELATWIEPRADWDQLVLPMDQIDVLREIVDQVRGRTTVHDAWAFRARAGDGLGIAALFEGDSGTGKSLAAEVVATALGLPVLRVDLAGVVSKYIGETEKNVSRIFAVAEGSGAVILFDEAEALFGKRTEVKDSHDRYANIEVAYLLQRVEAYRGLAILTSNARSSIDKAFLRRLRFVVKFPFPDQSHRERIWRAAFPTAAPTRGIDYRSLSRLPLAGGDIRNIALGAAFRAAAAGEPIRMVHIRAATRRELEKLGRSPSDADVEARR